MENRFISISLGAFSFSQSRGRLKNTYECLKAVRKSREEGRNRDLAVGRAWCRVFPDSLGIQCGTVGRGWFCACQLSLIVLFFSV